jgi:HSP20 family protein
MNLVKFNPFYEMEQIEERLNRLFAETPGRGEMFGFAGFEPRVDIQETDKEFTVTADLPDLKKEDIKVGLENGTLTIEGERKFEKEENGKKFHRVERQYGHFVRRFAMPTEVEPAKVSAEYKDGVLKVTMPKSAAAVPQSVEVKVA